MLAVAEIIAETGLPEGAVSILPMSRELGDRMVSDERFKLLTFTGSPSVGWRMKERAGKKKVVLELGGNAGVIVDKTADIDWAVKRAWSGPSATPARCASASSALFVHGTSGTSSWASSSPAVEALKVGDPLDPRPSSARWSTSRRRARSAGWTRRSRWRHGPARWHGRRRVLPADGPRRRAATAQVCTNEAFAPLVVAFPFGDIDEAIAPVNDSIFGLQTGVFTNDLAGAWRAFSELEVGGVIINDVPTYRIDHMPYGGVKDSGLGREGLRYAIEDMTELRIMVLAQPA